MTCTMIVSVHDVAPGTWSRSTAWLSLLDERSIPATLLVVAGPWQGPPLDEAPEVVAELYTARSRGHEISLHGWDHTATPITAPHLVRSGLAQLRARGCGEFAVLDPVAARERLEAGLDVLRRVGLEPTGFTPPGWLASPGTLTALRSTDLRYTTSQWSIRDLRTWRRLRIPAFSHRPTSALAGLGARSLLALGRRRLDAGRALRVALHPDDLSDGRLVESTLTLLELGREHGARFMTYDEAVQRRIPPPAPEDVSDSRSSVQDSGDFDAAPMRP